MGAWVMMLVSNLLTPLIMWGAGEMLLAWPPKEVNGVVGYRTRRSMVNQDTWDFANRQIALIWRRWGVGMLAAVLAGMLPMLGCVDDGMVYGWGMAILAVEMIVLCVSIVPVERALKRTFHEDGSRKDS